MGTATPSVQPPYTAIGPVEWLRINLFNTWYNSILTIVLGWLLIRALWGMLNWIVTEANWQPVTQNLVLYMVGQYPAELLWRIGLSLVVLSFLLGVSWGTWGDMIRAFAVAMIVVFTIFAVWPGGYDNLSLMARLMFLGLILIILAGYILGRAGIVPPRWLSVAWLLSLVVVFILLRGFPGTALTFVPTSLWGGLLLNLVLAIVGIIASFPLGVLLALGRRSSLPVVRFFSTLFIELVRGVPLISILFMASIMLPLFLPEDVRIDRVVRALIGITLFSAAYMAENVRGGLQAIPPGQYDAAKALALSNFRTTTLIILPQALRIVIPAIVGQFISLFKDTSLAVIVGLTEILGIAKAILAGNPEWVSAQAEVYLFVALVFWVFTYSMSSSSRQVEKALGVGRR